ncbi:hypothetical protein EDB89DRAFT_1161718 [Lactarius sanguifluus]|nr:hypothetical protein EDB89DRAFT_1161718 [Lactarius sanguifluus]
MNPFVLLTAFIALASALTVNTPASVVTCEPLKLTWDAAGSKSPFFLSIFPAGQPGVDALKQFPPQDGDNYTWDKVDLPPNTSFTVGLKDGDGNQAFSAPATVRAGSNTNCANTEVTEDKGVSSPSSSSSSTTVEPGVAAATASGGPTSSHASVAAAGPYSSTAPSVSNAPKTAAASPSGSNVSPSQSPGVKANSAARDTSSAVVGIMTVVGVMSVAIFLA